jgi:iron complex transport system permease protein
VIVSDPDSTPSPSLRGWPVIGLLFGILCLVFALDLALGSVRIPLSDIISILFGGGAGKESWEQIVLDYRLPRALTALLAGAGLSVAGLQMQTLFRNPLAGPFVLGINAGASLGVAAAVLTAGGLAGAGLITGLGFFGSLGTVISACLGSALVFGMIMLVSRRVESNMTLLILGLMFGHTAGAAVSVLLHFSAAEQIRVFVAWTFGSFAGVGWSQLKVLAPAVLIGLVAAFLLVKPLNALLLGESYARSMGLTVSRARLAVLAGTSLLAGAITAFCGPIAFLGVAVPHLCRGLLNTSDHRLLVPAVTLAGGVLALTADLVAQLPGSQAVLPLNAVTSLIGAPVIIWVILQRANLRSTFAS